MANIRDTQFASSNGTTVFNRGTFDTNKGSLADYMLSTSNANASKITHLQWVYRNRKSISNDVIKHLKKSKSGRLLLRKYKIRIKKT